MNDSVIMMMMNDKDGLIIRVCTHERGFSVTLQDAESGEFLTAVKVYPTRDAAIAFAESLA